ncbi:MAG: IPT/TIG domain-containing protein [Longimicrobiales bacterium]
MRLSWWVVFPLAVALACTEPSGPPTQRVSLLLQSGSDQFALPGSQLPEPLQVMAVHPVSKRPVANVTVAWRVAAGTGASIGVIRSVTGSDGVAVANARLGAAPGLYTFEATAASSSNGAARFTARAVMQPSISSIAPRTAHAGDTIAVTGTNFSTNGADNAVLFSGVRGVVVSASATLLRVVVPGCVPTRTARLTVALGAVTSAPDSVSVLGILVAPLQLQPGQALVLRTAADLNCQRFEPSTGMQFLLIPQNASEVIGSLTGFELNILTGSGASSSVASLQGQQRADFGATWELHLRNRERAFQGVSAEPMPFALRVTPPELGDRTTFQVFDRNDRFVNVTAEVKAISQHAIIYQDVDAPGGGFTASQFQQLGSAFDAPTQEIDVAVFGEPSDIDANGKVIILLTPIVNELTPRNSSGFVAGFFYGCDLQTRAQCSGTNSSEIFYLFVPDPTGRHGDARSAQAVMNAALPVLAHEFQHMISFGARRSLDALWLSEGLAHHAEDLVADEYRRRGDLATATLFASPNHTRATLFLRQANKRSLLSEELPGSLEQRGAGWLLVKYLAGHYGGNTLLRNLARSTLVGVPNVTAATGQTWSTVFSDWAVALYADDAPELNGVQLNARHTFNNINMRQTFSPTPSSTYPLSLGEGGFSSDILYNGVLAASAQIYLMLRAASAPLRPINLVFSGPRGGAFAADAAPQLTILRVR